MKNLDKIDALKINNGILNVPMVVIEKNIKNKKLFAGFVPGFIMNNIECSTIAECEKLLNEFTKKTIKDMYDNNKSFPFFPADEEIQEDFNNVKSIKRIIIKLTD